MSRLIERAMETRNQLDREPIGSHLVSRITVMRKVYEGYWVDVSDPAGSLVSTYTLSWTLRYITHWAVL